MGGLSPLTLAIVSGPNFLLLGPMVGPESPLTLSGVSCAGGDGATGPGVTGTSPPELPPEAGVGDGCCAPNT